MSSQARGLSPLFRQKTQFKCVSPISVNIEFFIFIVDNINFLSGVFAIIVGTLMFWVGVRSGLQAQKEVYEHIRGWINFFVVVAIVLYLRSLEIPRNTPPTPPQVTILPTFTIDPTVIFVTQQSDLSTRIAPILATQSASMGLNDTQREELRLQMEQWWESRGESSGVAPEELLHLFRDEFRQQYGVFPEDLLVCQLSPDVFYTTIGVRAQPYYDPENRDEGAIGYISRGQTLLAVAHNGGILNQDLWWFIRFWDGYEEKLGWVSSQVVDEVTMGCHAMIDDPAALFMGFGN